MSSNLSRLPKPATGNFVNLVGDITSKALRELKKVDPRERYVLLYPDSDSAHVGMGFHLLTSNPAEQVFARASEILKKNILKLCLEGPKSVLMSKMENRQVATFVTSHATMSKLAEDRPNVIPFCKAAGGVGVGFINSLVFSEAMSFEDGLDLVVRQSQAMDRAAEIVPNAKLYVHIRPATHKIKMCRAAIEHCLDLGIPKEIAVCSVTKQTHPHVLEVAGHEKAIQYLEEEGSHLFKFRSFSRVEHIPVAYNTELMRPASDFLRFYLDERLKENANYLKEPSTCSVYSATAGRRLRSLKSIKKDLIDYPTKPVKVEQLLHCLFARPKKLAQPNVFVLWDKRLLKNLSIVNRPAHASAKLVRA